MTHFEVNHEFFKAGKLVFLITSQIETTQYLLIPVPKKY